MASTLEPTPNLHDLLGCIPSCLQNFLVPDPAEFPSPPSTKSSEFPLSPPPPVFPEVQVLVACGLTILLGLCKAVSTLRRIRKQIWSLGPSQFLACYIIKGISIFWKTAAAVSVHRSRPQRCLNARPCQNLHFMDPPNSTGKNKPAKACSSRSAFLFQWIKT